MELLQLMIYSSKSETIEFKVVFVIALVLSFCRNIDRGDKTLVNLAMSLYLVFVCVSAQSHIQGANGWKTKQTRSAATDTQPPVGRPPPSEIQACDWSGSDRRDPGFLLVGSQAGARGTRGERNRVVLPPHQNLLRENFYNSCTCGKVLFRLFLYETSSARVYSG